MKIMKKLLFVTVITSIMLVITTTMSYATSKGTITGETVKLREEPSMEGKLVTLLSIDDKVEVIEKDGDWYKITYEDKTGYVHSDYIKVDGEVDKTDEKINNEIENTMNTEDTNTVENTKSSENTNQEQQATQENISSEETYPMQKVIRKGTQIKILPLIQANVIEEVTEDTTVTITEGLNGWVYVASEKTAGWVRKDMLKEEKTEEPKEEKEKPEEKTEDTKSIGYIKVGTANIRKEPSPSSEVVANLSQNTEVTILGEKDNWYQISFDGKKGYIAENLISKEKVATTNRSSGPRQTNKIMYVSVSSANIREEATTSSKSLGKVYQKDEVTVTGEEGEFYQVFVNNKTGYIAKSLLVESLEDIKSETNTTNSNANNNSGGNNSSSSNSGAEVVAYAKQFLGVPYQYGASGPKAFDCSGFTSYVYKHFGYQISRSSSGQSKNGTAVARGNLQAGDLVFFGRKGSINHVGIYIGGNQFIHAESPGKDVTITSLSSSYYNSRYQTARRILK